MNKKKIKEISNDTIDVASDLAAFSALRKSKNPDYLKMYDYEKE